MADHDLMLDVARKLHALADSIQRVVGASENHYEEKTANELKPLEASVTLEQVRTVLAEKSRDGFTAQVRELLQRYGASRLSEVDAGHYPALLKEAEVIGDAS